MPTVRFGRNYKMHAGKVVKTTKSRFDVHFDDDQTLKGMDPKNIWFCVLGPDEAADEAAAEAATAIANAAAAGGGGTFNRPNRRKVGLDVIYHLARHICQLEGGCHDLRPSVWTLKTSLGAHKTTILDTISKYLRTHPTKFPYTPPDVVR